MCSKANNDNEDCVYELDRAKIREYKKSETRWADLGVHALKILVDKTTKSSRYMRNVFIFFRNAVY